MWLYLLIFIIPVIMYVTFLRTGNGRNTIELAVYLGGLAIFVGLGDMLGGYDRYIYGEVFDRTAEITDMGSSFVYIYENFPSERGWMILNILISFYTENRYIFIFSITIIIYTLLFITLKRYAFNYPIALILFLGLWFFFSFTYLRQVLGATVAWLSMPYIIKRKFLKFTLITLLALTLHKSAIIFFPVYFFVRGSYSRGEIMFIMILALATGLTPLPNSLFATYGDMSQVELQEGYNATSDFRWAYLFEAIFFLWLMLRDYETGTLDVTRRVLFNMGCLFCATLLFFIRSENGGRLSWYYMIGIICTMSDICSRYINRKNITPLIIAVSFVLFMRIYFQWERVGNFIYPYKTFLTDGYRQNDPVRDLYEYDYNYDKDKFYRKAFRLKTNFEGIFSK